MTVADPGLPPTRAAWVPALPETQPGALRASYQALVEQIPAVLYINEPDADVTTIFVSPQTNEMLQLPESAWYDGTWTQHVHPDDLTQMSENYQAMLESASVGVDEYRFIRPDGTLMWIHDRVTIIRDTAGRAVLVQGLMLDVTEQREAEAMLQRQAKQMAKVDAIARRFSDLVLGGTGLRDVLDTLAGIVGNPVVFEDPAHQLVELAQRSSSLSDVLKHWDEHRQTPHEHGDTGTEGHDEPGTACAWAPVRVRDEEWGRLHVLAVESPIDELDRLALDRASAAVGLALMSGRDAAQLADDARSNLLADVWQGRWRSARDVIDRARSLGANLHRTRLIALVVEAGEVSDSRSPYDNATTRRRALEHLLDATRSAVTDAGANGLCAVVGSLVIAVVGEPAEQVRAHLDEIGDGIARRIEDRLPGVTLVVGASRSGPPEELRRALTEASQAAAHGLRTEHQPGLHHVEDVGLRLLLSGLGEGPELSRFVEGELGPLLDAESGRAQDLLETLRAYVDSGFHKARAAGRLHIERRTLYYRLSRIEALLDRRLDEPGTQIRVGVALQGLDLLRQRVGHRT